MIMNNPRENTLLSKDTNKALGEVANTIKNLGYVYKEEIAALEKNDNKTFVALQEKKFIAASDYKNDMGQMLARKNEINNASPSMKDKLKKMQKEFAVLSHQNMEAIERMQRCTERLGNTIRNAVIRDAQRASGCGYGENGTLSNKARRRSISSGLSETV